MSGSYMIPNFVSLELQQRNLGARAVSAVFLDAFNRSLGEFCNFAESDHFNSPLESSNARMFRQVQDGFDNLNDQFYFQTI